eukprot:5370214-Amphidinium_carterae.1
MKAHQKQEAVDRGMVTADVLANQGIAAHGPLDPDATSNLTVPDMWGLAVCACASARPCPGLASIAIVHNG